MSTTVFVRGLPKYASESTISEFFGHFGAESVKLAKGKLVRSPLARPKLHRLARFIGPPKYLDSKNQVFFYFSFHAFNAQYDRSRWGLFFRRL